MDIHTYYKSELEQLRIDTPGHLANKDKGLMLGAECHPKSGLDIAYWHGLVQVRCHQCHAAVCCIAVAHEPDAISVSA